MTTSDTQFGLYTQEQLDRAVAEAVENRGASLIVVLAFLCLPALVFGIAIGAMLWKP